MKGYSNSAGSKPSNWQNMIDDFRRDRNDFLNQNYTSVLDIEVKEEVKVIILPDWGKDSNCDNKDHKFGIGSIRGIDEVRRINEDDCIQEHYDKEFVQVRVRLGQIIRLTKTEYRLNKVLNSNFEKKIIVHSIPPEAAA